jgi:hypothetical protein
MYAQVDNEGNQYLLLQKITDHKKDNSAIPISEGTIQNSSGTSKPKVTTRGWFLLVQWRDGSTSWEKLADLIKASTLLKSLSMLLRTGSSKSRHSNGGYLMLLNNEIGSYRRSNQGTGRPHTSLAFIYRSLLKRPWRLIGQLTPTCGER